ncbi:hypothetical protein LXD69_11995 [Flavobacterium sediminilitoris]|uniref:Dolichyl-phosphate-mannose-protein mannosyltransferase n=1 Tax=Flavobacterium sediminilitoris TaxID=2024526 RepID=A0ABY4HIV1_9FLAO|nr:MULTISPECIES: hypothetical protein [Flavobacterium]UOX32757.1 hypothetical protein LXD69_11995 [Flavobacterium sediminilitoris]
MKIEINKFINFLIKKPIRNILIIGALLRLMIFLVFYTSISIYTDTEGYTELAKIISSLSLEGYHGLRSPGYPILISLANQNLHIVVLFQFILGLISTVLWYRTIINLNFSIKHSFIITIFISSFLNVFFFETSILVETLVLFFITLIIYHFSKGSFNKFTFRNYFYLSFLFGFLVLVKPFYAYLSFLFTLFVLMQRFTFKRFFYGLILVSCSLISYFGWCYVNKINTGYFAPTSYYGLTNAQTCVYFAENTPSEWDWISKPYVEYREMAIRENKDVAMSIWFAYEDDAYKKYNITFHELSFELGKFAKVAIKENPKEYIYQVVCRSWLDFWKPAMYWNYDNFNFKYANKIFIGIWYIQYGILILFELFFFFLLIFHVLNFFNTKMITTELILSVIVFSTSVLQAIVTYGTNDRYSFPFEFIIIIVVLLFFKQNNWFLKKTLSKNGVLKN